MPVTVKSESEIRIMRDAGKYLGEVHERLREIVKPGITTYEINEKCENIIRSLGCEPSFLGYEGFPASVCVSVNEEVVHGIPSKEKVLEDGDIVSLDTGVIYREYQSDAARTWAVGNISPEDERLIKVTRESFFKGIAAVKDGARLFDIGEAIEKYVAESGFGIVRNLYGHGIGRQMHEQPIIPNFKPLGRGIRLCSGMTIAVEPMITSGNPAIRTLEDGWTCITCDGSRAAHYENTLLVTDEGAEVLSEQV